MHVTAPHYAESRSGVGRGDGGRDPRPGSSSRRGSEMKHRSMVPQAVRATGRYGGKVHFAAGERLFVLLSAGLMFVPLIFLAHVFLWALLAWNVMVALLFALDLRRLPQARELSVERSFDG